MAVKQFTRTVTHDGADSTIVRFDYVGMQAGDEGEPITLPTFADRTVQVDGAFGVGGKATIVGSIIPTKFVVLTDPQANPLEFTTAKIETVTEMVSQIKPVVVGDGDTLLDISILMRNT